ncbi:MAG: ATP phosphoribosyltransferase [Spirochaetales bacterium]|nr:ATP phosphoribosyltransferase [Candidatus Physcosoma equi]
MINDEITNGRLLEKVYGMNAEACYDIQDILSDSRKLVFEDAEKGVRYFWVKPSDVSVYVERGAADIGVAGKDIIREYRPDVFELLDLNTGKCRMCVAGKKEFRDNPDTTLRVATKFSHIARDYYSSIGREIDIIISTDR